MKMSQMQLLRLFIGERLSAAAEEIFSAVQRTITEREEEAAGRHGPKQEVHGHNDDAPQVCAHEQKHFECEWSPASCHNNPSGDQDDFGLLVPEPSAIKQEQPWSSPDMEDSDVHTVKVTPTDMTINQAEVECLIVEFNALLGEPTVPGRAATGLERGKFRSILHNIFGITDDTMVDRGSEGF
ncbi:EF-hand calcium-binding domain-containing protein 1 [Liparis tanakae]|uniref:EF-hand calcium-binding domain-containing protein 1 n=1 Tax=Liparis tanakae TaxID=230148 RepID=A0A4Z2J6G2_9TELE|nr:EF-hand calcium-binding domain-containing protein 1 [Liparis tanakae]